MARTALTCLAGNRFGAPGSQTDVHGLFCWIRGLPNCPNPRMKGNPATMSELYAVLLSCMVAPGARFRLSKNPGTLWIVTTESSRLDSFPRT